jgi:hypothetical protein
MRLAVGLKRTVNRADVKRAMRPGGLRQVFDDAGDAVVAFDQQHVAGLDDAAQMLGIAGGKRLVARDFLLQVARNHLADRIEHYAHETPRTRIFVRLFCFLSMVASRFNLVHAQYGSIMIDLP